MADITHGTWVKDSKAVDAVYQDGIKVYERNLYIDTRDFDNPDAWIYYSNWQKVNDTYNGLTVMQTTDDWSGISQYIPVKAGEVYTFSFYAKYLSGTGKSDIYWPMNNNPENGHIAAMVDNGYKKVALTEDWQRYTATATIQTDGYIKPRLERSGDNSNTLLIAGLKPERGSTATPYSQAPEDVLK